MAAIRPEDVVPSLRNNVAFSRPPEGLGDEVLSVVNINNGEEVRVHGFELSLARLLDGHRTARQVIEAAERIGLPLSLGGLEGFVKKLSSYGLIAERPVPLAPDEAPSFGPRESWDAATRERHRSALRALRAEPRFASVFAEVDRAWYSDALAEAELEAMRRAELKPIRWRRVGVLGGLVAIIAAAMFVPFPHTVTEPAALAPVAVAHVTAPNPGVVGTVNVSLNQWVEAGDLLFTYDVAPVMSALEVAQGRLEKQSRELSTWLRGAPWGHEASLRKDAAEAAVANAATELERTHLVLEDGLGERNALAALVQALAELNAADEALDARLPPEARTQLVGLQREVQQLELRLADSEVRAPQAGLITWLQARPGEAVLKGMELVRIDDTRTLKAVAFFTKKRAAGVVVGQDALLFSNGRATQTKVARVDGPKVEVEVDNVAHVFEPGPAELQLRIKPQAVLP